MLLPCDYAYVGIWPTLPPFIDILGVAAGIMQPTLSARVLADTLALYVGTATPTRFGGCMDREYHPASFNIFKGSYL